MLKSVRFWIGMAISVVCLYFAFQGIQLDKLVDALIGMNYAWLLLAGLLWCVSYTGRVFRWQLLFFPQKMRLAKIFNALNIGYFLSNILPARLGDFVRAYLIGDWEGVSKVRAFSTVVVERISDGLTVVLLLAGTALFVPNIPAVAQQAAASFAVIGILAIVVLLLLSFHRERGMQILRRLVAPFPFLQRPGLWHALESLIDGFAVLRSPRPIIGVALWALYAWVTGGVMFWVVMNATGLRDSAGAPMPIAAAFLVMTVTSLVVVIPSSPGYVGVFHATAVFTLTTIYNVDKSSALSYAVV
ncbi:MAG: flippase-like domain-containing protein, partial [Chloroflexota bacterium]|nr:flippase-like domain-containing protein [Chloroflexota bacterium]